MIVNSVTRFLGRVYDAVGKIRTNLQHARALDKNGGKRHLSEENRATLQNYYGSMRQLRINMRNAEKDTNVPIAELLQDRIDEIRGLVQQITGQEVKYFKRKKPKTYLIA